MHDLAEVIRATGLKGNRGSITMADLINQEIERRGNVENDIMLPESSAPGNAVENLGPLRSLSKRASRPIVDRP